MQTTALRIELVVFGFEGTTIRRDDVQTDCLRRALIAGNVPVTREAVIEHAAIPKPAAIRRLIARFIGPDDVVDERVSEIHADFLHGVTDHYRRGAMVYSMPHIEETLVRLKRAGLRVALVSAFGRMVLDAMLDRLSWRSARLIDTTVAADEVGRGRPYPDPIIRAMTLTGVRRTETVTSVGEAPIDLEMGAAAECGLVVGVMNGAHTVEQLRRSSHTHLISHLGVLPRLVIGHGLVPAWPGPDSVAMAPG